MGGVAQKSLSFDAWRGVLAIIVCLAHAWQNLIAPITGTAGSSHFSLPLLIAMAAKISVFSFFALSGYVIATSVALNRERNGKFAWRAYAASRVFRIGPPLLFGLTLGLMLSATLYLIGLSEAPHPHLARPTFTVASISPIRCLATLCASGTLSTDVNGPLWSLDLEIQLYVISCGAVVALGQGRVRWRALGLLLAFVCLAFRPVRDGELTMQMVAFAAFTAGWFVQTNSWRISRLAAVLVCFVSFTIGIGFYLSSDLADAVNRQSSLTIQLSFLFLAFTGASFLRIIADCSAPRSLIQAGAFSYTLYVVHFPLLLFIAFLTYQFPQTVFSATAIAFVAVLLTIGFAATIAKHVERPKEQQRAAKALIESVLKTFADKRDVRP